MTATGIVRGTMIVATAVWAASEVLMRRGSPLAERWARALWTAAFALVLVHVVLAFHLIYAWDHEAAVVATVRQTADRIGSGWRAGIYVNYVFLALWLADVCWWWLAPASRASRSRGLEAMRFAVFVFMFFNAAVVFASPEGRIVGLAAMTVVLLASWTRRRASLSA